MTTEAHICRYRKLMFLRTSSEPSTHNIRYKPPGGDSGHRRFRTPVKLKTRFRGKVGGDMFVLFFS